jgi:hypothetical protein
VVDERAEGGVLLVEVGDQAVRPSTITERYWNEGSWDGLLQSNVSVVRRRVR